MISAYSFIMSVVLFNLALILVFLLRRKQNFIAKYGTQTLVFIAVLGLIRLISPVDFEFAYVIRSYRVIPALQETFACPLVNDKLSVGKVLLYVWGLGTAAFVVYDGLLIFLDKRRRDSFVGMENRQIRTAVEKLGIKHPVVVTCEVGEPHVAGFIRQKIYIPPISLSEEDLEYVLIHEMQHIRAHDQLIKLFYLLTQALFWWNPISHLFVKELDAILELRCDAAVAEQLDESGRVEYCQAMLNVIHQMVPVKGKGNAVVSTLAKRKTGRRHDIKQRFNVLMSYDKRKSRGVRTLLCVVILVVFFASYFVVVQPIYFPPDDEMTGVHEITETSAFILYDGEDYRLYIDNEFFRELDIEELDDAPHDTIPIINGGTQ